MQEPRRGSRRSCFEKFIDINPGKADWFAAGLPREGREAQTPRVADIALRDVPTCGIHERVGTVRGRVQAGRWELCVVVDSQGVVLGAVTPETADALPDTPVEQVMQPGPVTFRPHIAVGTLPEYAKTRRVRHAIVTTSDGVLIGLLRMGGRSEAAEGRRRALMLR